MSTPDLSAKLDKLETLIDTLEQEGANFDQAMTTYADAIKLAASSLKTLNTKQDQLRILHAEAEETLTLSDHDT